MQVTWRAMKIVIQNGVSNLISRKKMERLVAVIPPNLFKGCRTFILCATRNSETQITYHPKEQIIEFGVSSRMPQRATVEELLLGLELIQKKGTALPKISARQRSEILKINRDVITKCIEVLE